MTNDDQISVAPKSALYSSETGTTFLLIPILISVVLMLMASLAALRNSQHALARQEFKRDVDAVVTSVKMMYEVRTSCKINLEQNFGGTLQKLSEKSAQGSIQLAYPGATASGEQQMIQKDASFGGLKISNVKFDQLQKIFAADNTYLASLVVTLTRSGETREARIPYYFITDSTGKLADCFVTDVISKGAVSTREDAICSEYLKKPAKYRPEHNQCEEA